MAVGLKTRQTFRVTSQHVDDVDWTEYDRLWRASKWKSANCFRAMLEVYRPYYAALLGDSALHVLLARDMSGNLVGGFPNLFDEKYSNPVFWQVPESKSVGIDLIAFPRYGVLSTDSACPWLADLGVCLNDWSDDDGAACCWPLSRDASCDSEHSVDGLQYVLKTHAWRERAGAMTKELAKATAFAANAGWTITAEFASDSERVDGWIDDMMVSYDAKWSQRIIPRRAQDLACLAAIGKGACRAGFGLVTKVKATREDVTLTSVEIGFYLRDSNVYFAELVATDSTESKLQLGHLQTAMTIDAVHANLGPGFYDFGQYDLPYKKSFGAEPIVLRSFLSFSPASGVLADGAAYVTSAEEKTPLREQLQEADLSAALAVPTVTAASKPVVSREWKQR